MTILPSSFPRVQAARNRRICGPFDDGATVGEEGHLVGVATELQDEVVMADCAVRLESAIEFDEVDWALPLMDLHGISAAQGDVRAALSSKMNEVAFAAGATSGARLSGGDFCPVIGPHVEGQKRGA